MIRILLAFLRRWFMSNTPVPLPAPALPAFQFEMPDFVFAPDYKGVKFNPPPPSILPAITKQVDEATADLKPGELGFALVSDWQGGWNFAVGHKTKFGISIDAWMGSSWGDNPRLNKGVRVAGKWKIGGSE